MNLQENINRIHQMMGVISENRVIKRMVDELGFVKAVKYYGGLDNFNKDYEYPPKEEIIDIIKKVFKDSRTNDLYDTNINIMDERDGEVDVVSVFHPDSMFFETYLTSDGRLTKLKTEETIRYEDLPDNILHKVLYDVIRLSEKK